MILMPSESGIDPFSNPLIKFTFAESKNVSTFSCSIPVNSTMALEVYIFWFESVNETSIFFVKTE